MIRRLRSASRAARARAGIFCGLGLASYGVGRASLALGLIAAGAGAVWFFGRVYDVDEAEGPDREEGTE